jgi:hypothetical protein
MEVHIYPSPFRTGWIYCDIRASDRKVHSVHDDAFNAYLQCQHLDVSGTNFNVDVPGENLKKLREKYKNQ